MSLKEQLISALEQGRKDLREFMDSISQSERSVEGTYAKWSAKDAIAHIAYWEQERAIRLRALAKGEDAARAPGGFEGANVAIFDRFSKQPWHEIHSYVVGAMAQLIDAALALGEEVLAAPAPGLGEDPVWREVLNTGFTHPLMHIAEYYVAHGRGDKTGRLWSTWSPMVAPLDAGTNWQGLVHYNAACGLALSGNKQQALVQLREALQLRPSLTTWSRGDADLQSLRSLPEYRELYAPAYWWKALETSPQAEALADQFLRAFMMLREAIQAFPEAEWRKGDTPYQRPAGLALHALVSSRDYYALEPGDAEMADRFADWEDKDASRLLSQAEMLAYVDEVAMKAAEFLATADLTAEETQFRWAGSTLLGRAAYVLRHLEHHMAEMCLELHRRGFKSPQWR